MDTRYNVIKQIGKGAFSNVYLCTNKYNDNLFLNISDDNLDLKEFIIKKIDINVLVKKYMMRYKKDHLLATRSEFCVKDVKDTKSFNITPYNKTRYISKNFINKLNQEEEYYYKRLKELINSEIEILKRINHKNIIKYFDSNIYDDIYYIKMEYCVCGDLHTILKQNKDFLEGFDGLFIKTFLIDTVNGLKYLHDLNIIHRDIKLNNILITKENNKFLFKITDFGFACFEIDCELNTSLNESDIDYSSSYLKKKYYKLCGTPYYMAPEIMLNIDKFEQKFNEKEVIFNKFYDKKVDIWSYGVCLYELIFNSLPFRRILDINDFIDYFCNIETQTNINNTINDSNIIDINMKNLLKKLLTIDPVNRISTSELCMYIDKYEFDKNEIIYCSLNSSIEPIVECMFNINSWEKIDKMSSILKISIDDNFMEWLIK